MLEAGIGVGEGTTVGAGDGDGVGEGTTVGVGDGDGVGEGTTVGVGDGVGESPPPPPQATRPIDVIDTSQRYLTPNMMPTLRTAVTA